MDVQMASSACTVYHQEHNRDKGNEKSPVQFRRNALALEEQRNPLAVNDGLSSLHMNKTHEIVSVERFATFTKVTVKPLTCIVPEKWKHNEMYDACQ